MNDGQGGAEKAIRPTARNSPWAPIGSDAIAAAQSAAQALELKLKAAIAAGQGDVLAIVRLNELNFENLYGLMREVKLCADRNGFVLNGVEVSSAAFKPWREWGNTQEPPFWPYIPEIMHQPYFRQKLACSTDDDEETILISAHYAVEDDMEVHCRLTENKLYQYRVIRKRRFDIFISFCFIVFTIAALAYRFYS